MSKTNCLNLTGYWRFSVPARDQIAAMTQTTSDVTQFSRMKNRVNSYLMGQQPIAKDFAPSLKVLEELSVR